MDESNAETKISFAILDELKILRLGCSTLTTYTIWLNAFFPAIR